MRDRYYRVTSASEVPHKAVLVHVYRRLGQVLARLDGDDETDEAQPDLILFRAALERLRQDLVGTFVLLEDDALWQADWGNLVDYRGARKSEGPAPREVPAFPTHGLAPPPNLPLKQTEGPVEGKSSGEAILLLPLSGGGRVGVFFASDYTLNLNSITSPSLTT
jgi:hypothetical protein